MQRAVDFEKAVAVYGGFSGLARRLGEALSTVHGWARRERLPPWRARQIALMAKADRKDVFKEDGQTETPKRKRVAKRKRGARRKRAA